MDPRCRWIDSQTPIRLAPVAANRISGKGTGGASGTQNKNEIHLFDVEVDTSATPPTVKDGYALDDDMTINDVDGVYSRTEKVDLFHWHGKSYFLSLK